MIDIELIKEIVEKNISETDKFIIDVSVKAGNIVTVVLDSDSAVSVENCADLNRAVCNYLEQLGEEDFEVSVYSAGLNEPLKMKRQYLKYTGKEVEIVLKSGEKHKGVLISIDDDALEFEYEAKLKEAGVKKAKKILRKEKIAFDLIKTTKPAVKL
ncbi:MAG: ribosome assembly cofactor RimP [Prevotellaceae bacterium]|jgi:ribosome maturation factor RimP|nr:ribosome assembly cofactor RimP [Prevotellaceae bacterium]